MIYLISFFAGGIITTGIIYFEAAGFPLLSRLAALFPVFTWLSYLFIGEFAGGDEVARHSLFVLLGTIFAWIPYMLTIYFLAPKLGSARAVFAGITVFLVCAAIFIRWYKV